jgi:beta-fructofuranosidase
MHRRNFLQATGLLPFLGSQLIAENTFGRNIRAVARHAPGNSAGRDFFYKPENAWAADFIPLYANGEFQLFYLLDFRDKAAHGEGTPWYRISTKDFVNFEEHGEMLKRGSETDQDLYVFTGSAIQVKNEFHIFYTGHNPHLRQQGKPEQGVMHAISKDMVTWTKMPDHTFFAPADKYEKDDWRDPFVFWNPDSKEYNMLLAARHKEGIPRRRGLTALCSSKDLIKWSVQEPFYAPDLYFTHECPDLFKMGNWWYLLFSEFTDKVQTRYRMSRSLKGPWLTPERDDFDGHAFYAAKSASDGKKRFLFGWNPTRHEAKDNGTWDWGGNLVIHEIYQQKNGELGVKVPQSVAKAFTKPADLSFKSGTGNYKFDNGTLTLNAASTFSAAIGGTLPDLCRISTSVAFTKGSKEFGIMFRTSDDLDKSYYIRIEPQNNRMVFDKWPRERSEVSQMAELERPVSVMHEAPVNLLVIIEGNKGVAYINEVVAMNFRAYDLPAGNWGFFATDGEAAFSNIAINTI